MNKGVISKGIVLPIIKEGDDIIKIIVDAVLNDTKLGELFVKPGEYVKDLLKFLVNINMILINMM